MMDLVGCFGHVGGCLGDLEPPGASQKLVWVDPRRLRLEAPARGFRWRHVVRRSGSLESFDYFLVFDDLIIISEQVVILKPCLLMHSKFLEESKSCISSLDRFFVDIFLWSQASPLHTRAGKRWLDKPLKHLAHHSFKRAPNGGFFSNCSEGIGVPHSVATPEELVHKVLGGFFESPPKWEKQKNLFCFVSFLHWQLLYGLNG